MKITGLHLLLTYQCTFECEHCFVWGSPWQSGTLTLRQIHNILCQGKESGTVESIYFEGGEPTLYYPVLLKAVQAAHAMGFEVGIVSNAYWANSVEDALEWLRPLAGLIQDLSVSSDLFHFSEKISQQSKNASIAAEQLGIPSGVLSIAKPETADAALSVGQLPTGESSIMYRGRAAEKLAPGAVHQPWAQFNECPHEDLREPGRVHVDYLGNLHICQGISLGSMFDIPLDKLAAQYDPDTHPIVGPLLSGGPAELVRCYALHHQETYADACHLCYEARRALRQRFPERFAHILAPDQVYGVYEGSS